ncbi:EF-P beta-lysylation protein EpmB [Thalassolituus marinus]|uniref:L-lysine 2,3-aminomutase n=1 Tax=Thalassolituus marinus TaxID=671053 RepID=A0ABS7ZSQ5_9GAMM|nr:EF-P beta-lysylation protein EpmB [Thalassolituus marinus]MCA6064792.1 EF-P beta-lysylation protein EpmB [Thalassolituus marinus]
MPIITRSAAPVESSDWQQLLAGAFRNSKDLLNYLGLPPDSAISGVARASGFPVLVPRPYADQMEHGNPDDPLLRQVLTHSEELVQAPGFVSDPLEEAAANKTPGIIHKYRGRVLLLAASGCAVNCRYCFRRHFPYSDNRLSRAQWQQALGYIENDHSITEVILSGGDPLMLQDKALSELIEHCEAIPHVKRLRIHTRLPVVIPQRLTESLIRMLCDSRLQTSIVLHINHANELSEAHRPALENLRRGGVTLLNQSVLLRNVNNDFRVLSDLSECLFEFGIMPYYLHLLDRVAGAHHFEVAEDEAVRLHRSLLNHLPGYLVPRLVREVAGQESKAPINLDRL